jgi:hypothetical protein
MPLSGPTFRIARGMKILLWVLFGILLVVLAPFGVLLVGLATGPGKAGCERQTVSFAVSRDDSSADDPWVALLQESVCTDGAFVTVFSHVVQLVRKSQAPQAIGLGWRHDAPEHENDVLFVDTGTRLEHRPLLQWTSPSKLQVTIPGKSHIGLHKSAYAGAEIAVILSVATYESAPPNPR